MGVYSVNDLKIKMFDELVNTANLDVTDEQLGKYLRDKILFFKVYTKNGSELPKNEEEKRRLTESYMKLHNQK